MEFTQGVRFDSLGLTEEVQRALKKKNIEESTPVQAGCIPPMREWKDVIAKAPTGTGKTFAFGIPIIEHIEPGSEETEAVILAPTRELAMQITAELRDLCVYLPGVRIVCLYGGAPIGKQIDALKKHPQIVVATPGRLSDHMKRRTVKRARRGRPHARHGLYPRCDAHSGQAGFPPQPRHVLRDDLARGHGHQLDVPA